MNKQQKNWQIKLIFTDSYFKKLCVANHGCEIRSEKITFPQKLLLLLTLIVHYFTKFLKNPISLVFSVHSKQIFTRKKGQAKKTNLEIFLIQATFNDTSAE